MVYTSLLVGAFTALAAAIPQQAEHLSNAQLSRLNLVFARDVDDLAGRSISMDGSCGSASGQTCSAGNCCSSLGWCGSTPLHCGTGCQAGFGICGGGASTDTTPAPAPPPPTTTTTTQDSQPTFADKQPVQEPTIVSAPAAVAPQANSNTHQQGEGQQGQGQSQGQSQTQSQGQESSAKSGGLGDVYKQYSGDGSTGAGWPSQDQWVDFETAFAANKNNMHGSCAAFGFSEQSGLNSDQETQAVHDAILSAASSSGIDSRFILAILLQESGGCVRAPTTNYGVRNPGLMQSFNGQGTCNDGGKVQIPCPSSEITQMINDGTTGTGSGSNSLQYALGRAGGNDVSKYYKAARVYNSGSIDASGNLQAGIATHCYSSDIANRLTGWVSAQHSCSF